MVLPETDPQSDLSEIERLVMMATQYATASGAPPPKSMNRMTYGLIRDRLQRMKGPSPTKRASGPTIPRPI